jgi:N4-gp56 family major capsid protein
MATTTTSEIAGPVNRVFQTTLLSNAKVRAPYFVGSVAAEQVSHRGSFTAVWRRIENLTATVTALTELSGTESYPLRTGESLSTTEVTATISKYGQVLFLTEEVDLVNFDGQTDKLMEVLGISAGASLNRLQRNILEDNATLIYADGGSADGDVQSAISKNLIRNAVNTLQRNSAMKFTPETGGSTNIGTSPMRPSYWGLCHVDVEEDIRDLSGFIDVEKYTTQTATVSGEFGAVGGVRFIASEDASIDADSGGAASGVRSTTGTNADLYTTIVFGMEFAGSLGFDMKHIQEVYKAGDPLPAVELISHPAGSSGAFDPLNEVNTMSWKARHAGALLNGNWGRGIRTAASSLT